MQQAVLRSQGVGVDLQRPGKPSCWAQRACPHSPPSMAPHEGERASTPEGGHAIPPACFPSNLRCHSRTHRRMCTTPSRRNGCTAARGGKAGWGGLRCSAASGTAGRATVVGSHCTEVERHCTTAAQPAGLLDYRTAGFAGSAPSALPHACTARSALRQARGSSRTACRSCSTPAVVWCMRGAGWRAQQHAFGGSQAQLGWSGARRGQPAAAGAWAPPSVS